MQFDVITTGRVIRILHVVDEFTRESLADLVDQSNAMITLAGVLMNCDAEALCGRADYGDRDMA